MLRFGVDGDKITRLNEEWNDLYAVAEMLYYHGVKLKFNEKQIDRKKEKVSSYYNNGDCI
jgi:hypothetical protein